MKTRTGTLTITAAVILAAAMAGCNPGADAGPITTATPSSATSTPTTPPTGPSGASTTADPADPAATEAQDRKDAELVWREFTGLTKTITSLPAEEVEPTITHAAVDPALTRLRAENSKLRAQHQAGYGQDVSHITWPQPISGKDTAVLTDCQDGSQAGFLDTKTGNKLTVGTPNASVRGTLRRTPDGWRVADAVALQGVTCTSGV